MLIKGVMYWVVKYALERSFLQEMQLIDILCCTKELRGIEWLAEIDHRWISLSLIFEVVRS